MLFAVQRMVRPAGHRPRTSLVQLDPDCAGHMLLALVDQGLQHFPLGAEPEPVIDQLGIARHDRILQVARPRIQRDLFDPAMRLKQDGAAGGFIKTARLHPDKAVFHQIKQTDAVLAAQFVQPCQDGGRAQGLAVDRDGIALFKGHLHVFRRIGCLFYRSHALVDEFGRFFGRVFQHLSLGRGVQQIRVNREGRIAALVLGDWNLVGFCKFQQLGAAGQIPFAPRRDHLDRRVQGIGRQLEPDLIIALAGRPMGHGIGPGFMRNPHQMLRNQRPRDRGAKQIQPFVKCIGPEHRKDEIPHELFAHIHDVDILGLDPQQDRLLARWFKLFALAQIGSEGHDLAAIFGLQPFQDDRRIQTARIGEDDFFGLGHHSLWFKERLARGVSGLAQRGKGGDQGKKAAKTLQDRRIGRLVMQSAQGFLGMEHGPHLA